MSPPAILSKAWYARYVDKTSDPRGCWIWLGAGDHAPSRRVYAKAKGPIPDGLVVRHKCDNGLCVRLAHLELGTPADNSHDKIRAGTSCKTGWRLFIGPRRPHYNLGQGWRRRIYKQVETVHTRGFAAVHKHICASDVDACIAGPATEAC